VYPHRWQTPHDKVAQVKKEKSASTMLNQALVRFPAFRPSQPPGAPANPESSCVSVQPACKFARSGTKRNDFVPKWNGLSFHFPGCRICEPIKSQFRQSAVKTGPAPSASSFSPGLRLWLFATSCRVEQNGTILCKMERHIVPFFGGLPSHGYTRLITCISVILMTLLSCCCLTPILY
jgi:hypothetical protein